MEHEPYPDPRHQTRDHRAVAPPRHGLPLHRERTEEPLASGEARYRAAEIPDRDLCTRVLLAPPQGLQRHDHPEDPNGLVGGKVRGKCGER